MANNIIPREYRGVTIRQRETDQYLNATEMAKANGKLWADYWRLKTTEEFVGELSKSLGIPIISTEDNGNPHYLVESRQGSGTWVHPMVATHLAQWCSPAFAVQVAIWLDELRRNGVVSTKKLTTTEMLLVQVQQLVEVEREQERLRLETQIASRKADEAMSVAVRIGDGIARLNNEIQSAKDDALNAIRRADGNLGYFSVLGYLKRHGQEAPNKLASKIGKHATRYCDLNGIHYSEIADSRWGTVNIYPESVLDFIVPQFIDLD